MQNIPSIIQIEYAEAKNISLPEVQIPNQLINISANSIPGAFTKLDFVGQASFQVSKQNDLYQFISKFRIKGISLDKTELLRKFERMRYVFLLKDTSEKKYLLGTNHVRAKFEYRLFNAEQTTGWRGYNCEIRFQSRYDHVYCS